MAGDGDHQYQKPDIGPAFIAIGSSKPIQPCDQHVREIAEFALKASGKDLILTEVDSGQIVDVLIHGNKYYNCIILAKHSTGRFAPQGFYSILVSESPSQSFKELLSFNALT